MSAGNYFEAEKQFRAALTEAEKFGPGDPRYSASLENLAKLYQTETRNKESGLLGPRSLSLGGIALSETERRSSSRL